MRGVHRVLKLARTIADLAGSEEIENAHLHLAHAHDGHGLCLIEPAEQLVVHVVHALSLLFDLSS